VSEAVETGATAGITVYWRPGCGFCSSLMSRLHEAGFDFGIVNIWEQPDAAAFVRGVARGNETVPTVAIGGVALVNPSPRQVLETALEHAPDAVPDRLRNAG
jgi:glutaredoxin-like protein